MISAPAIALNGQNTQNQQPDPAPQSTGTAPGQLLFKIPEVMRMLRMSRSVLYEQIRSGRLHTIKQGRATFITFSAIAEYISLLEHEAQAAH